MKGKKGRVQVFNSENRLWHKLLREKIQGGEVGSVVLREKHKKWGENEEFELPIGHLIQIIRKKRFGLEIQIW